MTSSVTAAAGDDGYRRDWCSWRLRSPLPCHPRRISWVIVRRKQGSVLWAADAGYGRAAGWMRVSVNSRASPAWIITMQTLWCTVVKLPWSRTVKS